MSRQALPAALAAVLLALAAACGDGGGAADIGALDPTLRQALQRMVLPTEAVPEGMQRLADSFATNEDAASGLGGGPTKEQLDGWGRVLGYDATYQAREPSDRAAVVALSTSATFYRSEEGAAASFESRVDQARRADWRLSHTDLSEFQQEEMDRSLPVDDSLWLRFTGFKEIAPGKIVMVADDQIAFRVDNVWGFLGSVSTSEAGGTDRNLLLGRIEALAQTQVQRIKDVLAAGIAE